MKSRKNKNINKGAALLAMVFVLLFFALLARFAYIETTKQVEGKGLAKIARDNWQSHENMRSQRGTIFDAGGKALAKDVNAYTVVAILSDKAKPDYVKDPKTTAKKLAPILHMDEAKLQKRLSADKFQVELGTKGRRISFKKKEKIEKQDLSGIHFRTETKRYYPNQTFASYLLGFTKRNEGQGPLQGVMGIEKNMNEKLTGQDGSKTYRTSANGVKLPAADEKKQAPRNGDNVHLTIDNNIQTFLEHAMTDVAKKYQPKQMMAAVLDPKTGKILAMSNRPTFNPNKRDLDHYSNAIVSDSFEPGSTMKIFTLSAAVDAGVYNGDETYKSGTYKIPGGTIHDWNDGLGFGTITYNQGVRRSSNVAFARLANKKIGFSRFHAYLKKFDFDEKTGIDLPNEAGSHFQYDVPIEKATTAFGQGTSVTPLQQLKGATAVANDGKMMKPYIVDKVVDPNDKQAVLENKPKVAGEPISSDSATKVRDLLRSVVTGKNGTGKDFAVKGYKVAGKTGTAQIPKKDGSGYENGKYIHSFLGMAPKDDPQFMMYVAVDEPKVKSWHDGSKPVAKIFRFVTRKSMQYLNIDPEQKKDKAKAKAETIRDYQGQSLKKAKKSLQKQGFDVLTLGSGKTVVSQQPMADTSLFPGERVMMNSGGKIHMPDLAGWSFSDVGKLAELLDLKPDIKGSGYVSKQNIPPGDAVKEGETLSVQLSPPKSEDEKVKE